MLRTRLCARPGCSAPAAATFSYRYATRTVWLDDLAPASGPAGHDLCAVHADALRVPRGWTCEDRRSAGPPAPSAIAV